MRSPNVIQDGSGWLCAVTIGVAGRKRVQARLRHTMPGDDARV
jgi:hypothetical protein